MATTNFTNYQTVIDAAWLNDVNGHTYSSTPISPATTVHPANVVGYTPSGTGAIATTVQAKLRESVSVEDYGITGTANDSTVIQAAITAAGTLNKSLRFTKLYLVGTTLLGVSNSTLIFEPTAGLKATAGLSGDLLYFNTKDKVVISGGEFDGSSASAGTNGIHFYQSTNCTIVNQYIHHTKQLGVYVEGSSGTRCNNIFIENLIAENCLSKAITFIYTDYINITGGKFTSNDGGITSGQSTQITISGLSAVSNTNDGIALGDSCSYITITGCHAVSNGGEGINIDGCNHATITGNTSLNNLIGITCWNRSPGNVNAGFNIVSNNVIKGCLAQGILLADTQPRCIISGNIIDTCGGTAGIDSESCKEVQITGNTITHCTGDGIFMTSTVGAKIVNNYIYRNAQYGIELGTGTGTARIFIADNHIQENGDGGTYKAGIYDISTSYNRIVNNYFVEDRTSGLTQIVTVNSNSTGTWVIGNYTFSGAADPTQNITGTSSRQINNQWNLSVSAAPTAETWAAGDVVWNAGITAGGQIPGWVCITSGTPGTWKAMAVVAA